jgi:hypothetical protein
MRVVPASHVGSDPKPRPIVLMQPPQGRPALDSDVHRQAAQLQPHQSHFANAVGLLLKPRQTTVRRPAFQCNIPNSLISDKIFSPRRARRERRKILQIVIIQYFVSFALFVVKLGRGCPRCALASLQCNIGELSIFSKTFSPLSAPLCAEVPPDTVPVAARRVWPGNLALGTRFFEQEKTERTEHDMAEE